MREQIISLLGSGLSGTEVAAAVGCTPGWISQLLDDENFAAEVQVLRAARTAEFVEHDGSIQKAEAEALKKVSQLVPFITRPGEAAKVFSILNAAKRKATGGDGAGTQHIGAPTVILELPAAARVAFTLTSDKQVIDIEGRTMTTMPARNVQRQLEAKKEAARLLTAAIPEFLLSSESIAASL